MVLRDAGLARHRWVISRVNWESAEEKRNDEGRNHDPSSLLTSNAWVRGGKWHASHRTGGVASRPGQITRTCRLHRQFLGSAGLLPRVEPRYRGPIVSSRSHFP